MQGMTLRAIPSRLACCMLAVVAVAAAACTPGEDSDEDLPDAQSLLESAAEEAAEITSMSFAMQASGEVPGLVIRNIQGEATTEGGPYGAAQGTATLTFAGQNIESDFVLEEESLHLRGPTGDFQEVPVEEATQEFDPSAVLDPDRGVANLIGQVRAAETTGTETIDDTPTYQVEGTIEHEEIDDLLPGLSSDAEITLWLAEDGHIPIEASLAFPDEEESETPTVDVTLSDVNEPVTVTSPE